MSETSELVKLLRKAAQELRNGGIHTPGLIPLAAACYDAADILDRPALSARGRWEPIETAPRDERVFFWIVPKLPEECPLDSSGNPIFGCGVSHRHEGKYGTWSGLEKAIYWMPLPELPAAPESGK